MKRVLFVTLVILLAIGTRIEGGRRDIPSGDRRPVVVATIFPAYDFTRAIAGDKADIHMLLPPGTETHLFELTPQDILKIRNCDLFVYAGGESDHWVKSVLESLDTSKMKIITLVDCVEAVAEETVEGMEKEDEGSADGKEKLTYDEHVWTSPRNAKLIAQEISGALCEMDAAQAEIYKTNTVSFLMRLDRLDAKFKAVVDHAARKLIVFGDRFPFLYFVRAYGLDYYAAFPGCAAETEASPATVKFLIDKIKAEKIPVVFHIEMSNGKMARAISEATGAKVMLFHACHNISHEDFLSGKTYLDLMNANVEALKEALD
ncbi:MAG: metal ABC transporter substrate-binding protein [Fusobacteriaceae bacterium]|jgi:zinc transport system substrate-binding protein|nr:metal ABC transporter substrate-binding protein [Fusobacteriaceae bacterium]